MTELFAPSRRRNPLKIWAACLLAASAMTPVALAAETISVRVDEAKIARLPELAAFQSRVIAEVMAVTAAKGIRLPTPDLPARIEAHSRRKFNQPSMLQHVEAGRRTEIDALTGALLREAAALGIATPCNEALVALLKGRELHRMRAVHEPDLDFAAWEARIARGEED